MMGEQSELDGVYDYPRRDTHPSADEIAAGTALVAFDASEPATVRNAPGGLAELAWQARALSSALTLPKALQGKPGDILAVMLAGRELGIGPMASTRMVHIISGQTSIATELKLALAKREGHEVVSLAEGAGWCIVGCATHPEAGATGWRMTAATAAPDYPGLTGWTIAGEIMVEGWGEKRGEKVLTPLVDKANWRAYERDMLFWRAASQFMRRHCPAVAGGLLTAEELGEGDDDGG